TRASVSTPGTLKAANCLVKSFCRKKSVIFSTSNWKVLGSNIGNLPFALASSGGIIRARGGYGAVQHNRQAVLLQCSKKISAQGRRHRASSRERRDAAATASRRRAGKPRGSMRTSRAAAVVPPGL